MLVQAAAQKTGMSLYRQNVRHFGSPFYIANALMILAYAPLRLHWYQHGLSRYTRLDDPAQVYEWESQCAQMITFVLAIKSMRDRFTLDVLLGDVFLYCKAAILTITFMVDPRVCAYFGIVFVLLHLMAPQPYRDYTGAHNTRLLTSSTFTELVVEGAANKRWLVLYFKPGKVGRQVNAVAASLSLTYADDNLHFGRVNTQANPDATQYVGVNAKASFHGATFVLFQNGQELQRLPKQATSDPTIMSADNVAKVFQLDAASDLSKTAKSGHTIQ